MDPTVALMDLPAISTLLVDLALRHSHASRVLGSRNLMYLATPADDQCPQYYEKTDSITWHLNTGMIRS